jgi:hypothetical protein
LIIRGKAYQALKRNPDPSTSESFFIEKIRKIKQAMKLFVKEAGKIAREKNGRDFSSKISMFFAKNKKYAIIRTIHPIRP